MNSITSEAHFRQRVLRYSEKNGVTAASIRYRRSRQAIYEWKARYDGTWKSLVERSHRPHHHPNEHTAEEKEMILRLYARHKDDMMVLWDSLKAKGYKRSYGSKETLSANPQTIQKSRISRSESTGRCEVCADILCVKRQEILSIHGC